MERRKEGRAKKKSRRAKKKWMQRKDKNGTWRQRCHG